MKSPSRRWEGAKENPSKCGYADSRDGAKGPRATSSTSATASVRSCLSSPSYCDRMDRPRSSCSNRRSISIQVHRRALGSLFFATANRQRQLIVETHSDYIIDRVRMDLRDRKDPRALGPSDVSVLYFERDAPGVRIHSLSIDRNGNVVGAPDGYGAFFMQETRRSIGL